MFGLYVPSRISHCASYEATAQVDFARIGPRSRIFFKNVVTNLVNPYSWSSIASSLTEYLQLAEKLPMISIYHWYVPVHLLRNYLPRDAVDLIEANGRMLGYREQSWSPGYLRHSADSNHTAKEAFKRLWPIVATQMHQHVISGLTPSQQAFRQQLLDAVDNKEVFTTRVRSK